MVIKLQFGTGVTVAVDVAVAVYIGVGVEVGVLVGGGAVFVEVAGLVNTSCCRLGLGSPGVLLVVKGLCLSSPV